MQYPSATVWGTPTPTPHPRGGLDKLSLRAGRQNQINDMNFLFKDINAGPPSDDIVWPEAASTSGGLANGGWFFPKTYPNWHPYSFEFCANKQETEMRQRFWVLSSGFCLLLGYLLNRRSGQDEFLKHAHTFTQMSH